METEYKILDASMPEYHEREAKLEELIIDSYKKGDSMPRCAKKADVSVRKVSRILNDNNVETRYFGDPLDEEKREYIKRESYKDYCKGLTYLEIANKYNISEPTVAIMINEIGYPYNFIVKKDGYFRRSKGAPDFKLSLFEICEVISRTEYHGEGLYKVAEDFGVHYVTIKTAKKLFFSGEISEVFLIYNKFHDPIDWSEYLL